MLAVAFGLGNAVCWGLADFLGGLRAKQISLAVVLLVSQLTALVAIALVVGVGRPEAPSLGDVAPAFGAGVCQLFGIASLYRALAIGTMSIVSPVSAGGAAAIPVIVGFVTGDQPPALVYAGMAAALAGVVLATRAPSAGTGTAGLRLAAIAALGFGGFYIGMDAAVENVDPFFALLAARVAAGVALVGAVLALRPSMSSERALLPSLVLIGVLDVSANLCFSLGAETGLVSVVSVLASLYPVGTVLLAWAVLGERLVAVQAVGVAVTLAGVALIAAG